MKVLAENPALTLSVDRAYYLITTGSYNSGKQKQDDNRICRLTTPGTKSYFTRFQSGNRLRDKWEKLPRKFYVVIDASSTRPGGTIAAKNFADPVAPDIDGEADFAHKTLFHFISRKIPPRVKARVFYLCLIVYRPEWAPSQTRSYLALYFIPVDISSARCRCDKFQPGGSCTTYRNVQ